MGRGITVAMVKPGDDPSREVKHFASGQVRPSARQMRREFCRGDNARDRTRGYRSSVPAVSQSVDQVSLGTW